MYVSMYACMYINVYEQPVPEKLRLEMVIAMQNKIQIGIKKLSSWVSFQNFEWKETHNDSFLIPIWISFCILMTISSLILSRTGCMHVYLFAYARHWFSFSQLCIPSEVRSISNYARFGPQKAAIAQDSLHSIAWTTAFYLKMYMCVCAGVRVCALHPYNIFQIRSALILQKF